MLSPPTRHGAQGILDQAGAGILEQEFGTKNEDEVVKAILQGGAPQKGTVCISFRSPMAPNNIIPLANPITGRRAPGRHERLRWTPRLFWLNLRCFLWCLWVCTFMCLRENLISFFASIQSGILHVIISARGRRSAISIFCP